MSKLAIYTAIFGGSDNYKEPPRGDYDCFVFTDMTIETRHAKVVQTPLLANCDPRRTARMVKLLPHLFLSDYKYSLWIDGSMKVKEPFDLEGLIPYLKEADMATFKHRHRSCIYEEAGVCATGKLDFPHLIRMQMNFYRAEGYLENAGLFETGILLRRVTPQIIDLSMQWWDQVAFYSKRDQLSLPYIVWKKSFNVSIIDGNVADNRFFSLHEHVG